MTVAARPAWGTSLAPNDDAAHAVRQAWHPGIFGTPVQVTALETGQAIMVRIKDGGPFGRGRIIDLSRAAADQLGTRDAGVARGRLEPTGSAEAGEGFVPAGAVGLVAIAWYRSTRSTSSAWTARTVR